MINVRHFGIQRQLAVLVSVFLVPITLLTWLLVAQSNKDIQFAAKELAGTGYLAVVTTQIVDVALGRKADPAGLRAVEQALGGRLDSADAFQQADDVLNRISRENSSRLAAIAALRALVARVGDTSNLILDPDLDSYYAMDVVVVRMPEVMERAAQLRSAALSSLGEATARPAEVGAFLAGKGAFSAAVDGVDADLVAGYRGNADGQMKGALDAAHQRFRSAHAFFTAALGRSSVAGGPGITEAELNTAYQALGQAAQEFWPAAMGELNRLLDARISGFRTKQFASLTAAALALILALVLSWIIARTIIQSTRQLRAVMNAIAGGDIASQVPFTNLRNETGAMARSVEVFRQNAEERGHLLAEQDRVKQAAANERRTWLASMTADLDQMIVALLQRVQRSSEQFETVVRVLSAQSQQTEAGAATIVAATEQASSNVESVAAAAGQLTLSIRQIGDQVARSSNLAASAAAEAKRTDSTVRSLSEGSIRIGEVIKLISDIAGQTNLLALNATIEAARAGEAGKGFAVVAGEVKSLANQTARATEDIAQQVAAVQGATQEAVKAIATISARIAEVNEIAGGIAAAVDQQAAATSEIAASVQQASEGTREVAVSIGGITSAVGQTSELARQIKDMTEERRRNAEHFGEQVSALTSNLRAKA